MRYQQKLEHIRHSDNPRKMDDERRSLLNKISELKNEVQVWENNIGFFAKSKNAEKLKSEFEEKIKNAKEEINKLKGKLEMVKDAE
jgi:seryl-tRNA synthetase